MKKFVFSALVLMFWLASYSTSLTILLEDSSSPCEVYLNGESLGEIKDSIVMNELKSATYKVSMFSAKVLDGDTAVQQDSLNPAEKAVLKLEPVKKQEALNLGTETVFIPKDASVRITVKNKQVNAVLGTKKSGSACCLGGAGGCCLGGGGLVIGGVIIGGGLLALLGWGIYMLITEGLPDID